MNHLISKILPIKSDKVGLSEILGGIVRIMSQLEQWDVMGKIFSLEDTEIVFPFLLECLGDKNCRQIIALKQLFILNFVKNHLNTHQEAAKCAGKMISLTDNKLPLLTALLECPFVESAVDVLENIAHHHPDLLSSVIPSVLNLRAVFSSAVFSGDSRKISKLSFLISEIGCALFPHLDSVPAIIDMQTDMLYSRNRTAIINGIYFWTRLLLIKQVPQVPQYVTALCYICTSERITDEARESLDHIPSAVANSAVMSVILTADYEASLFVLTRVNGSRTDPQQAQLILQYVISRPLSPNSLQLLGVLSPHYQPLEQLLSVVLTSLTQSSLAHSASRALYYICNHCSPAQICPHAHTILQTCLAHSPGDAQSVVGSLVDSLCRLPPSAFAQNFHSICHLISTNCQPVQFLRLISSAFKSLSLSVTPNSPHPSSPAFLSMWPTLLSLMDSVVSDPSHCETYVRCLRHIMRHIKLDSPSISNLLSRISLHFPSFPHPGLIYLTTLIVEQYHSAVDFTPLISVIYSHSLGLLKDVSSIKNNPDYAEDFFRLSNRLVTYKPPLIANFNQHAMTLALTSLFCENKDVISQSCAFICSVIDKITLPLQLAQEILNHMILSFISHPTHLSSIAKSIQYIYKLDQTAFPSLLQCSISKLPRSGEFVRGSLSENDLLIFYTNIINHTDNIKHVRSALNDFTKHFII